MAAVWPSAVLLAAVGPLEIDEAIPAGVVAVTRWAFRRIPTSYLPTRGIRRVPNNLDLTFRNDLISYISFKTLLNLN